MHEFLNKCPYCGDPGSSPVLESRDYFLTKEPFSVYKCDHCGLKFTNPRPSADQIGKYYRSEQYISHTDTNRGLINKLYRLARKFSVASKARWIGRHRKTGLLLDYGCGTGEFLNHMEQRGWKVMGVEPDGSAREMAAGKYNLNVQPVSHLKELSGEVFDVITLWHVLEHVYDLHEQMELLSGILGDDGLLFVAVPNSGSYDASFYGNYWAAWDLPRHLYHFDQNTLRKVLEDHGYRIIERIPMKMDAFYISMLSEKYKNGGSGLLSGIYRGFISNIYAAKHQMNYSSIIFVARKV